MLSRYINLIIKNKSGALLMNLLVTLGIIAVISVISIPNLREFQRNAELSDVTRELVSNIRYAQQLTITEQITHGVVLYTSPSYYEVVKFNPATTTIKSVNLPSGYTFTDISGFSMNLIEFNSYGSVDENGTIEIENSASSTKNIEIKPSGYVDLQ